MRILRLLSITTAGVAYAVIVIGFVVRITNSGMGCGPDWPLCNGRVIPAFTSTAVAIEWSHRVAVLGLTAMSFVAVALAWRLRGVAGASGPGGTVRPAAAAFALLILQSWLGRGAVKTELSPGAVVIHLLAALALLATFLIMGLRAGVLAGDTPTPAASDRALGGRSVLAAVALAVLVLLMGGLTATTGAATACQGFPLCSGQFWPSAGESGLPHLHWTHRLLAYALALHLLGLPFALGRKGASARLVGGAWIASGLAVAQVTAGAVMVLAILPPGWRVVHAALGTAVWVGVVYLAWLVSGRRDVGSAGAWERA